MKNIPIKFLGTSQEDIKKFPVAAKREAGYQLHRVQSSLMPNDWKPFKDIGPGVVEIRIKDDGNEFRIMYVAKFAGTIFVLHAFQKKTQQTRKADKELAQKRYKALFKQVSQ